MAGTTVITLPKVKISFTALLAAGDTSAPATFSVDVGTNPGIGFASAVGTAAGQVNAVYAVEGTVTAGAPVTIDVTSLTDPAGNAIPALVRVMGLFVENLSTTAGQILTVAGGASNPLFSDQFTLQPNTILAPQGGTAGIYLPAGYAVDGTHKTVKITAAAGTAVAYNLAIFGNTI